MSRRVWSSFLALFVLAAVGTASDEAFAQGYVVVTPSFSPRLYVGAQLGYNHILNGSMYFARSGPAGLVVPDDEASIHLTRSGFGWSLYAGLRFSPWLGAELGWDALYHPSAEAGTYNYAVIDGVRAALRVHIPTMTAIEPYFRLGLGWYFYGDEFQADENGLGFSLGAGINWRPNAAVEMELVLLYRAWYFAGMRLGGEDGDFRCGDGYCPFGDRYVHSLQLSLGFHWNSWIFSW